MTIYKDIQGFKDHEKSFNGHKKNCQPYLVYGTRSFIVMNMAIKCYINLVLLPKPLQAFPSHRFFKWTLHAIPVIRRIAKDPMSRKNQPRLFPPIYWCKAFLDESVLFWSFPPVMFTVCYAETEHTVIGWIPTYSKKCTWCILEQSQVDLAVDMLGFKENVNINNIKSNENAIMCHLKTRKALSVAWNYWKVVKLTKT